MPSGSTVAVVALAAYLLAVVPGPAVLYIVNRSVAQGRRAGALSASGIAVGGLVHVTAAALGVSAVLASSAVAFTVVKWAGAVYLVYLGIQALRNGDELPGAGLPPASSRRVFTQGVVVNVLNPKTAIFFLSFLPQFADPGRGLVLTQLLVLGLVFVCIAFASDLLYAVLAGTIRRLLERRPAIRRTRRWVSAAVLFGLGAAAVAE